MRTRVRPFNLILALSVLATLAGCGGEPEPTRRIQLGTGLLDMSISESWEVEASAEDARVYTHKGLEDVQLRFTARSEDFGQPLPLAAVKSLVGKELNLKYGGVSTRVSLGGNAMIRYTRNVADDDGRDVRLEEWVIAKPVGHSHIARVEITLRVPVGSANDPAIPALVEALDRQVGDAKIPRA